MTEIENSQNEILRLRRELAEAHKANREWERSHKTWQDYAARLEREVISSNEYRAFVRHILSLAVEALEIGKPLTVSKAKRVFEDALEEIRDWIIPPEDERQHEHQQAEVRMLEGGDVPR